MGFSARGIVAEPPNERREAARVKVMERIARRERARSARSGSPKKISAAQKSNEPNKKFGKRRTTNNIYSKVFNYRYSQARQRARTSKVVENQGISARLGA